MNAWTDEEMENHAACSDDECECSRLAPHCRCVWTYDDDHHELGGEA